jgi:anti-sigma B factor antagonist
MDRLLTIDEFEGDGVVVLTLDGEIDASVCQLLHGAIERGMARARRAVVLDMGAVSYMDSAGLRCLIVGSRAADAADVRFAIGRSSPAVQRLLGLCGLGEDFLMARREPNRAERSAV